MKKILVALALLALEACSSGGSPPYNPPPPITPITPRPGVTVLDADWSNLNIGLGCGGSPFGCAALPPDKNWSALLPGASGGRDCSLPLPNNCYQPANGLLGFTSATDGMALISAVALDPTQPMSIEVELRIDTIDCTQVSYAGGVLYGGGADDLDPTGNYKAWYISCFGGDPVVKLWLYTPVWAGAVYVPAFVLGQTYTLGIDWYPGDHVDYRFNRAIVYTENAANTHGSLAATNPPHPALWTGGVTGEAGALTANSGR